MCSPFYASLLKTGFVYVTEAHSLTRLPRVMHFPALLTRDCLVPSLEAVDNRPCSASRFFFFHMIRLLHCLMDGKKVFLSASARFDAGVLMQSDDKCATITALPARLTVPYHDSA